MLNQKDKRVLREESYGAIAERVDNEYKIGDLELIGRGTKGLVFVANRGTDNEVFAELKIVVKKEGFDGFEDVEVMREKMEAKEKEAKEVKEG